MTSPRVATPSDEAILIWEKALGPEHPDVALSLNDLAQLYQAQGRYDEAEPLYERELTIAVKRLGPHHPTTRKVLHNLSAPLRAQGRDREADRLLPKYELHPSAAALTRTFKSQKYGWTIRYPETWQVDSKSHEYVLLRSDTSFGLRSVHANSVPFSSVTEFADVMLARTKRLFKSRGAESGSLIPNGGDSAGGDFQC